MKGCILIVEDEMIWRERLADALIAEGYVVHLATVLEEARQLLQHVRPDIVTLDMTLRVYERKRKQGYALLEDLDVMPNSPEVIIVSETISRDEVRNLWRGYDIFDVILKKNYNRQYFIQTIRDAVEAKRRADAEEDEEEDESETSAEPLTASNADAFCALTEKEKVVIREVARGKSNKEIAQSLKVTVNTIKKHLANASAPEKLDTTGRINLVNKARELGCIPRDE